MHLERLMRMSEDVCTLVLLVLCLVHHVACSHFEPFYFTCVTCVHVRTRRAYRVLMAMGEDQREVQLGRRARRRAA